MKLSSLITLLIPSALAAPLTVDGLLVAPLHRHADALEGEYMITFKDGHTLEAHEGFLGLSLRESIHTHWDEENYWAPFGYTAHLDDTLLALIRADPMIDLVEQDYWISVPQNESGMPANVTVELDSGLDNGTAVLDKRRGTRQRNAPWNVALVSSSSVVKGTKAGNFDYDASSSGAGVDIYIVDSGINIGHEDFGGRAKDSYDATETVFGDEQVIGETYGHGTGVADVAGGRIYGVAKNANILNVKVVSGPSSRGTASNLVKAIKIITRKHSRRLSDSDFRGSVVNYSVDFAGPTTSQEAKVNMAMAVRAANDISIIQVAAAGNSNNEASNQLPAGFAEMITVASMTDQYQLGRSSSYGTDVDIIAPGVGVTCAAANTPNGYITVTGTSFAAPLVAGVCAQYLSYLGPQTSRNEIFQMLTAFSIKNKVDLTSGKEQTPNRVVNNGANTRNWPGPDELKH